MPTFESHKAYIRFLTSTLNKAAHGQSHLLHRPVANILGLVEGLKQLSQTDETLQDITSMLAQSCKELNKEFEAFVIGDFSDKRTRE